MTAREEVEKLLRVWQSEIKHSPPSWAPSHWPKTLKALAKWMAIVLAMGLALGFIVEKLV